MCENNKNIVLIGMPGSGKTTIGKILSERLGIKFVDMDQYIEEKHDKSILELFSVSEEHFRNLESEAIHDVHDKKNIVISTGGGVIKNQTNIKNLKKNGVLIFIDRDVDDIASDVDVSKRPLLKDGVGRLYDLFNERYHIYKSNCDVLVKNDSSIEDIIKKIIDIKE